MTRPTRRQALVLGAAPILTGILAAVSGGLAQAAPGVAAADDMSLGPANAKITVVEYASLSCPHCAHFNETVFPAFKAKYVDTGRVRYTLKELLTPPQQLAAAGFLLARCAGPGKYFKVVDEVFRSQARWRSGDIKAIFVEIAQANGLTEAQFEACLQDEAAVKALDARVARAVADGINSTPSFFVNGKAVEVATLADFDAAIAAAGKPAAKAPAGRKQP